MKVDYYLDRFFVITKNEKEIQRAEIGRVPNSEMFVSCLMTINKQIAELQEKLNEANILIADLFVAHREKLHRRNLQIAYQQQSIKDLLEISEIRRQEILKLQSKDTK